VKALLAIQDREVVLAAKQGALVLRRDGAEARRVPIDRVLEVHLYGPVNVTAGARELLLKRGVEVVCLTSRGSYIGRWVGLESRVGERRVAQITRLADPAWALGLARRIVAAKLGNQRVFCQRLARDHGDEEARAAVVAIGALSRSVGRAGDVATLMGLEGRASVLYYRALGRMLRHPEVRFERRTRRPPRDPVNACLSFGYTLLLTKVESALRRAGLEVYVGALHQAGRGKPALALDVMEPWRPWLVDRMVWRLFNRQQLGADDFESPPRWDDELSLPEDVPSAGVEVRPGDDEADLGPAVYLGPLGRDVFLKSWGRVWRVKHLYPPREARYEAQQILDLEVQALARDFESGELSWEPWQPR